MTLNKRKLKYLIAALVLTMANSTFLLRASYGQVDKLSSETELLQVLANGQPADKAMACKRLAVYGSAKCVPEVAKLLADPQLASWARITLEAIPDDESKQALRSAVNQTEGLLAIGVINSLGVLRDSGAVDVLTKQLDGGSAEVASAAALALGRIGTENSVAVLRKYLDSAPAKVQPAVVEGCVLGAQNLLQSGQTQLAIELYDQIRSGNFAEQRIIEATRGAIVARGEAGIELLVEQLRSPNRKLFALGLQTARELDSDTLAAALVGEIGSATPERAALIVAALAELKGRTDLTSLKSLASSGAKEVRLAAIEAIGRVGNVTCVEPLISVANENSDLTAAVRAALVAIADDKADAEILSRMSSAQKDKQLLIEVVGLRQLEATDQLVKSIDSSDESTRAAALQALGQTVPQAKLGTLVSQVVTPKNAGDLESATRALKTAAIRMPDREACAATLADAVKSAPAATKPTLLEIVAAVGGTKALQTVGQYAMGTDLPLRDVSTRLLGEWMTADVAPVLYDVYTTGPKDQYQDRAMRGYIRVARQMVIPEEERIQMCEKAMKVAKVREQKALFDVVKRYPSVGMIKIAINALKDANLTADATAAIQAVRTKLSGNAEAMKLIEAAGIK